MFFTFGCTKPFDVTVFSMYHQVSVGAGMGCIWWLRAGWVLNWGVGWVWAWKLPVYDVETDLEATGWAGLGLDTYSSLLQICHCLRLW